jgi:hypothetical protein
MSHGTNDELLAAPPEQSFFHRVRSVPPPCVSSSGRVRERERERERGALNRNKTRLLQPRSCAKERLKELYYPPQHFKEDEMSGTCGTHGDKRNTYKVLMRKSEGKKPLGRPKVRWANNIIMDFE